MTATTRDIGASRLRELEARLWTCNKCGTCTSVCPLYSIGAEESLSARGKLALIGAVMDGELSHTRGYRRRLYGCLLCRACEKGCASGIPTYDIMMAARAELAESAGRPRVQDFVLRGVLAGRHGLRAGAAALRLYQRSGLGSLVQSRWFSRLLPAAARAASLAIPEVSMPARRADIAPGPARAVGTVGYFMGCAIGALFPNIAVATRRVLAANGYMAIASTAECCGGPHQVYGDLPAARALARRSIDRFESLDTVVTDCASCGSTLKEYPALLADDTAYAQRAKVFAAKVRDISEFAVERGFRPPEAGPGPVGGPEGGGLPLRVTYHDPCHLSRGQGVRRQPRAILQAIPGVELVEMDAPDRCCGGAGLFFLTHTGLAESVGRLKALAIAGTHAAVAASGCPACLMQLRAALSRQGQDGVGVVHPVELLAKAYDREAHAPKA